MVTEIGAYTIDSLSVFLALCGIGGILITIYLYQFKDFPGTSYLALLQFFTALWAFFYFLEYSATDLQLKLFWSKLSYTGIAFTPIWFYLFSLRFIRQDKVISRSLKIVLFTIGILINVIVLTNDYHHLHWREAHLNIENNTTIYTYGPLFWFMFLFFYSLLSWGIFNILKLVNHSSKYFKSSVWYIVLACIIPIIGNFMYVFKVNPIPGFDWTPVTFVITGSILAYINIKFDTFSVIPFARNKLFDLMEDAIFVIDNQLKIVDTNNAFIELLNTNHSEVIGKKLIEVFPHRKELIERINLSETMIQETIITETIPETKHLDVRVTPLYDKKNSIKGRLLVFRDITKRMQFSEKLVSTNKELKKEIFENAKLIADLDAFAHTVAHDLRDSIGAIAASTDLIKLDIDHQDYNSALETNQLMGASANKTLYVIRELLTMATIRQQDVILEEVDMAKVIVESEKRLKETIKLSNATIIKPESWPASMGNPFWLEEVWVNYIGNAIKYGDIPPIIELGAEQLYAENKIKFWVKDNGNGLTKSDQDKLFLKFSRLDTKRAKGTGLGLSIVKRIVEKLDGEVGVFSNAVPGEGCLFYFILPAH